MPGVEAVVKRLENVMLKLAWVVVTLEVSLEVYEVTLFLETYMSED